ncbi:MAG TPA: YbaN family protein [Candidatus Wallbacteria bacterium]|nr:YbaN family protein [Candidatus Wallbacteria bacterium]
MLYPIKKYLLITAGLISTALAVIGIFLPLLPTTPFLLLAAACFVRSSDSLYHRLMTHRIFGEYIKNYTERRAIALKTKITALAFLWLTISYSAFFVIKIFYVKLALLVIAACVTWHILSFKTI